MNKTVLETGYDPKQIEDKLYHKWMEEDNFKAEVNPEKKPFTIVIPPPNITGQLHMGHALDEMIQDALIRYKRMQGFEALWLPGTDHASIATEVKIVEKMAQEGLKKEDIGREAFLERAWEWKRQFGGRIVEQLKKLGSSCDWSRERFTMDEGCSKAVREVFVRLYEKGLIYRGNRIINWCPDCQTALSDAEVEYEEKDSNLWHIRYPGEDGSEGIIVATTRPETMLGDTAVAVNPQDERYAHLIGKNVILPLMNRPIPVIADEYVELGFGTGAVKITPAHDPNDFEVGQRHNLPVIRIMDDAGIINEQGGKYQGLDRDAARKAVVADLEECGLMVKIEPYKHNVGQCYRCKSVVEPLVSTQWFVSMKKLAEPALEAVRSGEVKFVPERFNKIYFGWLENIRDWCISRQLWWGHRIPAFYCEDCGEMTVSKEDITKCPKCGSTHIHQDEDVLDTWFSSGLWPFSTLGWPEDTPELKYFYPTDVLVTGYDIIFFWVARMIIFGMEVMGKAPFHTVNIHGIVRDAQGRKMSKSLGNGIDPLEIIDHYGADALRISLAIGVSPGSDMRFTEKKVEAFAGFANKIWNAARFILMYAKDEPIQEVDFEKLNIADKWIIGLLNTAVKQITENMDHYELGLAAQKIYDFIWSEFCDWYVEMTKPRLYGDDKEDKARAISVLVYVLKNALKLLHPFMPFVTEEVFLCLSDEPTIMRSSFPAYDEALTFEREQQIMEGVKDMIRGIRNARAELGVAPKVKAQLLIKAEDTSWIDETTEYFKKLAFAQEVVLLKPEEEVPNAISYVNPLGEAFMPLAQIIDVQSEIKRLAEEAKRLEGEIKRASGKLQNQNFVSKAPEKVVEEERQKLQKYQDMKQKVEERMIQMEKLA